MVIDIDNWLNTVTGKLQETFSENLIFIGLQGSYNRGEATTDSDIDLVVILNELDFEDLKTYRKIINEMPNKDLACGFISGKKELQNWSKADLFQFFYDTKSIVGNLEDIIQPPTIEDIKGSIKTSSEALYHSTVHSFVHSSDYPQDLQNLYKMTFFILQAKYFIKTNKYIPTKKELINYLKDTDKKILNTCINRNAISNMTQPEIEKLYNQLINWCSRNLINI